MQPPPPAPMGSMIPGAPPPPLPFQAGSGQGFAPAEESPEVGNLFSDQANLISAPNEAFFGCENVLSLLDDDAKRALDNLSEEVARKIVLQLSDQRSKVNNPSAYVMKAVRNAQHESPGASRPPMQALPDSLSQPPPPMDGDIMELEEELGMVSASLDEKALSALHELPAGSAVHIVRNLRKQEAQVTNASAWVCKAVGNMKRPPPPSTGAPEFAKRARV
ncbi:unnamed protein product [Symbiodinium microadriaticum]|nr:unnamed protein product [Symbiodinium microadriaticum]